MSEQLAFSRDFSSGFRYDRDYRNLSFASVTRLATDIGNGSINLAYMDHPFGADQFYGNFNSWEDTKTWFAGVQQALGAKTSASFSFRRHSDLFVLYRDRPDVFANHHSDESYQLAIRRREEMSTSTTLYYGVEGLHESIVSNNLGGHARSRGAAYAAADFRAIKRFSLTISAREELYRSFSAAFTPTVAAGVWLSPQWKVRAPPAAPSAPSYTDLTITTRQWQPHLRPESAGLTKPGGLGAQRTHPRRPDPVRGRERRHRLLPHVATDIWRALSVQNLNFKGWEAALRWTLPHTLSISVLRNCAARRTQSPRASPSTRSTIHREWCFSPITAAYVLRTRVGVIERTARSPYALWDIYAGLPRHKVHPYLQVSNATNTSYQSIPGVAMPGRTIVGGVEVVFRKR